MSADSFVFRVTEKNIILCILKEISPFKMHKVIFYQGNLKKILHFTSKFSLGLFTLNTCIFYLALYSPHSRGVKFPNKLLALRVSYFFSEMLYIIKVLHKLSKLLLPCITFYSQMRAGKWNFTPLHSYSL